MGNLYKQSYENFFKQGSTPSFYLLSMMNVKYIIRNQEIDSISLKFAEDRAYFVKELMIDLDEDRKKRSNTLYMAGNIDSDFNVSPSDKIYLTSNPGELDIAWDSLDNNNNNISKFKFNIIEGKDIISKIDNSNPNEIIIKAKTSGPQFLVVSEVFYPNGPL